MNPRHLRALARLRHADAAQVTALFPPARRETMLAAIYASGEDARGARGRRSRVGRARSRRVPRLAPALAGACALAAFGLSVLIFAPGAARHLAPAHRATVVSFRYPKRGPDSGYIVATVTDPYAAQSALDAAFKAAGLDITVTLVPVSPSIVGTVVALSEGANSSQIESLGGGACVTGGGGCPIGVKVPDNFSGSGSITIGRAAQPGESYDATASAFAPGEVLHCSGLLGAQVSSALAQIASDGITAQWSHTDASGATTANGTPPPGSYYIWDATSMSAGTVRFDTEAAPLPPDLVTNGQRYDQGCPGGGS